MNGKTISILVTVITITFLLFAGIGCGKKTANEKNHITMGICMSNFTSPYVSVAVREFKRYAQQKGYQLIILDSDLDIQKEDYNIDNLMSKKVDAILVNVVDSKGSRAALKKAAAAGFTVICSNSTVDDPKALGIRAYTGPQYYEQGTTAARMAIKAMQGRPANVVMITGTPGYSAAILREQGFTDTIVKEGTNLKMLDMQTANWMREDAQRIMSDYITKYGDKLNIVYTHDDNMTVGAVNALKAAGYTLQNKPLIVSIGAMADGLPLIQQGWIDASIMQSPKEDAQLAIDTAIAILEGRQVDLYKDYFMDTTPVDKSNVQKVIDMHMWD